MLYILSLEGVPAEVKTEALRRQKERRLDPRWEWWESFLQMGLLPHWQSDPALVSSQALITSAREHSSRLRDITATALGRFLGERGCEGYHKSQGNFWRFPSLLSARNSWEKHFGRWMWKTEFNDWQARRLANPADASNVSAVSC